MKKTKILLLGLMFLLITILPSCAIIFCGQATTACQKTKPAVGQPSREVHVGALIGDILIFWPALIVDFATNAIYKPCTTK